VVPVGLGSREKKKELGRLVKQKRTLDLKKKGGIKETKQTRKKPSLDPMEKTSKTAQRRGRGYLQVTSLKSGGQMMTRASPKKKKKTQPVQKREKATNWVWGGKIPYNFKEGGEFKERGAILGWGHPWGGIWGEKKK